MGNNYYVLKNPSGNCGLPIHAEEDAINKLKPIPLNRKRYKKVSIVVVRFSKSGILCSSAPCVKCMNAMAFQLPKKGYKLEYIYYSDSDRKIHKTTLKEMVLKSQFTFSLYWTSCFKKTQKNDDYDINDFKIIKKLKKYVS